jgi:hypothetical protein
VTSQDDTLAPLHELRAQLQRKIDEHDLLLASDDHTSRTKYLDRMVYGFCTAVAAINLAETRNPAWAEAVMRLLCSDLIQSALSIRMMMTEGFLEPARRELRYMLERAVASVYIDQSNGHLSLEDRVGHFQAASRSFEHNVEKIAIYTLDEAMKKDYRGSLNNFYSDMCRYVHPSAAQVMAQLRRSESREGLGFESTKMIEKANQSVFNGLDLVLVAVMQGIATSTVGDLFVHIWDSDERWPFHKSKFVKKTSAHFDYKVERANSRK